MKCAGTILSTLEQAAQESRTELGDVSGQKPATRRQYLIALTVVFTAAYAQYLIPGLGPITGAFSVYGISIATVSLLYRTRIVRRAFHRTGLALKLGLALFGIFALLGVLLSVAVFYAMLAADPSATKLLNKPLPLLNVPPDLAWIMVWVSLFVVGPAEEYIFRGFVYGGLLNLFGGRHWFLLAFVSSMLFALAHLYYAAVYGLASIMLFIDIVAIGLALSITYYLSGGNLFIPALIHGAFDATGFLAVAVSTEVGLGFRGLLTLAGLILAMVLAHRSARRKLRNG